MSGDLPKLRSTQFLAAGGDPLKRDVLLDPGLAAAFHMAKPFPHVVVDGLFAPDFLDFVEAAFDLIPSKNWLNYVNASEYKTGTRPNIELPPAAQAYFDLVYSGAFLRRIAAIARIPDLIPDPWLVNGGLHELPPNGYFDVHVDFERHPVTGLKTRLVLITFLNRGWQEEFGANLELWDADRGVCEVRIVPEMGRSVLFLETAKSLHGNPQPNREPGGRVRRAVVAYFYSSDLLGRHPTNTTRFFSRPHFEQDHDLRWWTKRLLPPIVHDALSEWQGRRPPWKIAKQGRTPHNESSPD